MTDIELINKALSAKKPSDLFTDNWKEEHRAYSKLIHPDLCKDSRAGNAMAIIKDGHLLCIEPKIIGNWLGVKNTYQSVSEEGINFLDIFQK